MENLYQVVTLDQRPELKEAFSHLHSIGWTKFMREDPIGIKYWNQLLSLFPHFQFLLLNNKGESIACGNAIPFYWDGHENRLPTGWDGVLEQGMIDNQGGYTANTLSALAIVIHPEYRGQGLSKLMVSEMKKLAKLNGIHQMVAPVRPSLKSTYPLIPIEDYVNWNRKDGSPFDPWLRTHCRLGATILTIASESMVIPAPIEKWETWVGMELPATGSYIIQDGLVPLDVDKEKNRAVYIEPNVWVKHHFD